MQVQIYFFPIIMRIMIDMINTAGIECAGPANDTVYFISFTEEKFCQIGTILAGYAGN